MSNSNLPKGFRQGSAAAGSVNGWSLSNASDTLSITADHGSERSDSPAPSLTSQEARSYGNTQERKFLLLGNMQRDTGPQTSASQYAGIRNGSYVSRASNESSKTSAPGTGGHDGDNEQDSVERGQVEGHSIAESGQHAVDPRSRQHEMYPGDGGQSVTESRRHHTDRLSTYIAYPDGEMQIAELADISAAGQDGLVPYESRTADGRVVRKFMAANPDSRQRQGTHAQDASFQNHSPYGNFETRQRGDTIVREAISPHYPHSTFIRATGPPWSNPPNSQDGRNICYDADDNLSNGQNMIQSEPFEENEHPLQRTHAYPTPYQGPSSGPQRGWSGSVEEHREDEEEEYSGYGGSSRSH